MAGNARQRQDYDELCDDAPFDEGPSFSALTVPRGTSATWSQQFLKDMAAGTRSEAEVCRQHGIQWLDWLHIKTTPAWKKALAELDKDERATRLTFREKCAEIRDSTLPVVYEMLMDNEVSPAVRMDAFKAVCAGAGDMQDKKTDAPLFSLQINLGDRTINVAAGTTIDAGEQP